MTRYWFPPCLLAIVASFATELSAQNLLLNPTFNLPNAGSDQGWIGDYLHDPALNPSPQHLDDTDIFDMWANSKGEGGIETTSTTQTIGVGVGETVSFTGYIDCNASGLSTSTATINIWDGDIGGTLIGTATMDHTTAGNYPPDHGGVGIPGSWLEVNISGTANSGKVTIELAVVLNSDSGTASAFADAFSLTSTGTCAGAYSVTSLDTTAYPNNGDLAGAIVGGTNLDQVTSIALASPTLGEVLWGSITNTTPTALTVTFPTTDALTGIYNVLALAPDCQPEVLLDTFEVLTSNLLLNPGFNVDEDLGNAVIWFGDYKQDPALNPNPQWLEGDNLFDQWSNSKGEPGIEDTVTYQIVPVASGDTVTFTGWLRCNATTNSHSDATVTLYDGTSSSDPVIGTPVSIDELTPGTDEEGPTGSWVLASITGVANSGYVTVELTASLNCTAWGEVASAFADAFRLESATTVCSTTHTVTSIIPVDGPHDADVVGMEINGSNLDYLTAVKLVQVATETIIEGSLTTSGSQQRLANFPTNGNPIGFYNLVTEQRSCVTQVLVDGFEVFCANPTTITGITPSALGTPQTVVDLTIEGTNLDALTDVYLSLDMGDETGTIRSVAPDGLSMVVRFYLTDAEPGFYDVVGLRSDACDDPEPLIGGLALLPPCGENLLINGDFEADGPQPTDTPLAGAWHPTANSAQQDPVYNPSTWVTAPVAGDNCASISGNIGNETARIAQNVTVLANFQVTFEGYLKGRVSSGNMWHRVRILDGDDDGAELAVFEAQTSDFPSWLPFSIEGIPTGTTVTVEWGYRPLDTGWLGAIATHADELSLVQACANCGTPFADADNDGDADQDDFAILQSCFTGSGGNVLAEPTHCICFDVEGGASGGGDGDVDQGDVNKFEQCASGPEIPADPGCLLLQ